jgi:hypothetical protein
MRAASALVVAVGLGVALSVILTSMGLRASQAPALLGVAVLIAACVYIGWLVAQLTSTPMSLVAAPIVVTGMIGVLLGVKLLLLPLAPLVGDGIPLEIFLTIYAATGASGALLGQVPWLRIRAPVAARTGLWLTGAALVLSATTLVFDAATGA